MTLSARPVLNNCFVLTEGACSSPHESTDSLPSPTGDYGCYTYTLSTFGGANRTTKTDQGTDKPVGVWHSVTTDANGRVIARYLYSNNLRGSISAEPGNLTLLNELFLSGSGGLAAFTLWMAFAKWQRGLAPHRARNVLILPLGRKLIRH